MANYHLHNCKILFIFTLNPFSNYPHVTCVAQNSLVTLQCHMYKVMSIFKM